MRDCLKKKFNVIKQKFHSGCGSKIHIVIFENEFGLTKQNSQSIHGY